MAYEPTEWKSGDVVTSAKLNKIEQGIVGTGIFAVETTITTEGDTVSVTTDKTFSEIKTALDSGKMCVIHADFSEDQSVYEYVHVVNPLEFTILTVAGSQFTANSADDYLVYSWTNT